MMVNDLTYYFIRVAKNESFDYLYCQRSYSKGVCRGSAFEYAGIFCRSDGKIYDGQYIVQEFADEDMKKRSAEQLRENLQCTVQLLVKTAIADDRRKLKVTELSNPMLIQRLKSKQCYYVRARRRFLETEGFEPPTFQCFYEAKDWTEESLLLYISDPQGYAAKEAAAYIDNAQEKILFAFLENDAELAEYQAIVDNTEDSVHITKKIMAAMKNTPAKTVNVTICKDGKEFSFKTETRELRRDCISYYGMWDMVAADRREFERQFGRCSGYYPKEIVRITYARKVLYEV